jgi:hypothetical protein
LIRKMNNNPTSQSASIPKVDETLGNQSMLQYPSGTDQQEGRATISSLPDHFKYQLNQQAMMNRAMLSNNQYNMFMNQSYNNFGLGLPLPFLPNSLFSNGAHTPTTSSITPLIPPLMLPMMMGGITYGNNMMNNFPVVGERSNMFQMLNQQSFQQPPGTLTSSAISSSTTTITNPTTDTETESNPSHAKHTTSGALSVGSGSKLLSEEESYVSSEEEEAAKALVYGFGEENDSRGGFSGPRMRKQKNNKEYRFFCNHDKCEFKTKWKGALKQHELTVHSSVHLYKCKDKDCDYKTNHKGNLKSHERKHGNSKPYKCPFPECNYSAKWHSVLKQHKLTYHKSR